MPTGRLDSFAPPPPSGRRLQVLGVLAAALAALDPDRRVVVAIDGVDGAGKTVLARELHALLAPTREVHRVSVDRFHRPAEERYARGRTAETFFNDSYDHDAIRRRLVEPFLAGGEWLTGTYDVERECSVAPAPVPAAARDAILLVDGVFLHRPELVDLWDATIWVEVPFAVSVPRGNDRFGPLGPEAADPMSAANARYVVGQQIYLGEVDPARRATWILDNTDLVAPHLVR